MNLRVMRPTDGIMMKLVKYNLDDTNSEEISKSATVDLIHNHDLKGANEEEG